MANSNIRLLLTRRFHIPKERSVQRAVSRFTSAEKALFYFFTGLFIITSIVLVSKVNNSFLVDVPIRGGTITEGVIGNPRFINPVLAISDADKNLVSLIYSGLVRPGTNNEAVNDLAESINLSSDGLTYTAIIRQDALFHDGSPVTADDVVFTMQKIMDPAVKSPLFGDFAGVSVSKLDDRTVSFTLRRPYAPFINNLSVGILPKSVWSSVTNDEFSFSQWNVLPLGSGPYKVETVTRDSGGIPDFYDLVPFEETVGASPYIAHYTFKFYPSVRDLLEAYDSGEVQSISGISPVDALALEAEGAKIISAPLPRIFGVFFNPNSNKVLLDSAVREALDLAAPKEEIVRKALSGFGTVIHSPLPPGLYKEPVSTSSPTLLTPEERWELASTTLAEAGWTRNEETGFLEKKSRTDTLKLTFTLSTSDNPDLRTAAEMLRDSWQKLGVDVQISIYEVGDLNQNVIRPRRYDALLFGEVVGREMDVYPFWHSSERNDPGLNIALYANSTVDKLLADARIEHDREKRVELYREFDEIIKREVPAVFLYSPSFLYIVPPRVMGIELRELGSAQDRFLSVRNWYIETNSVWNVFADN